MNRQMSHVKCEERIKFYQTNIVTSQSVMAASSSAVSVLTPNGRRQTVKVSPNTLLLQVRTHLRTRESNREGCVCVCVYTGSKPIEMLAF